MERRNFLKFISALSCQSIFLGLAQSCLDPKKQELEYDVNSSNLEYYFQFNLFGSPARWTLDSFLDPYSSNKLKFNSMVGTAIDSSTRDKYGFNNLQYKTIERHGLKVPHLWGYPIKTNSQGKINIDQLLSNMLAIRGCDMKRDGHEFNNRKLVAPTPGELSITGQISDLSDKPIPVVHLVGRELPSDIAYSAFKAKYGTFSGTIKSGTSNIEDIFKSWFSPQSSKEEVDDLASEVLPQNLSEIYKRNSVKANKLIDKSFEEIFKNYKVAREKYQDIITSVFAKPLKDITSINSETLKFPFRPNDGGREWDHKWVFAKWRHEDLVLTSGWEDCFKEADWHFMADQMAVTETLVKFGIIQSAVIIPNAITNIFFNCIELDSLENRGSQIISKEAPQKRDLNFEFDSHNSGTYLTLVANSYMQLALMGCISKFVDFLKEESLYNKSLIHVTSEFEREPATSEMGSEHGWNGHSSIFYSGIIQGPNVIGNIEVDPKTTMFKNSGTWGAGGKMSYLKGRQLEYGNISSSIAKLIGFPTPTPNRESLVEIRNGKVVLLTDECRNI
jgi:hypothetical protein